MIALDPALTTECFGQLLRNALALDRLLQQAAITIDPIDAAALAETLTRISASIAQQGAQLHALAMQHAPARPEGERRVQERRQLPDRRWRP